MQANPSAITAHDELLRHMPPGALHDGGTCPICVEREGASASPTTQEVAHVSDTPRTFTEKEHETLLAEVVRREVASATESQDAEVTRLQGVIDALEAEKAASDQKATDAEQALADLQAEHTRTAEVASRKDARIAAVQRISARELPESYFTDERVMRWAEMADEAFAQLLDDIAAPSIAALTPEEASELDGTDGEARLDKLADLLDARREAAASKTDVVLKETAAFSGGQTPSADTQEGSFTGRFLQSINR
jgi:hypothetical protein